MTNEQVLAIVDAIRDIERTLSHTLGDDKTGSNDGNVGNIMFSMDRIADKMENIDNKLSLIEQAITATIEV